MREIERERDSESAEMQWQRQRLGLYFSYNLSISPRETRRQSEMSVYILSVGVCECEIKCKHSKNNKGEQNTEKQQHAPKKRRNGEANWRQISYVVELQASCFLCRRFRRGRDSWNELSVIKNFVFKNQLRFTNTLTSIYIYTQNTRAHTQQARCERTFLSHFFLFTCCICLIWKHFGLLLATTHWNTHRTRETEKRNET